MSAWLPSASIEVLKKRSQMLQALRAFFIKRDLFEVDVPIFNLAPVSDVHLNSVSAELLVPGQGNLTLYAHTSPEYKMKQLLCAGSGDIFYLGKVFRNGDLSPRHQIEFTMLEWYRIGFKLSQLIAEVVELICSQLGEMPLEVLTYQQAFERYAGIEDIFSASAEACRACLTAHQIPEVIGVDPDDKPLWRQLVLTEVIEPQLGRGKISCITHFPAAEAALAKISPDNPRVAERFEIFVEGMELANGYDELQDAETHRQRFEANLVQRQSLGLPSVPLDEGFLTALEFGLPACSGVALGVDRLFMLQQGASDLALTLPFALTSS